TNNRMELTAVIRGLQALTRPSRVELHVDSQYVMKGMTEWIHGWTRNGWRTAAKKPVANAELWRELDELITRHEVTWTWVRGIAGDARHERADELAIRGVEEPAEMQSARARVRQRGLCAVEIPRRLVGTATGN